MRPNAFFHQQLTTLIESKQPDPTPIRPFQQILLYGCGALGELALQLLQPANLKIVAMIDAADKWQNQKFHGLSVYSPDTVPVVLRQTCTTAICIANYAIEPIADLLRIKGFHDIRHIYDITEFCIDSTDISNGWYQPNPDENTINIYHQCINLWADDESRYAYLQFLSWHIRRIETLYTQAPVRLHDKYRPIGLLEHLPDPLHLFDIGAYDGMAIKRITREGIEIPATINAFEPDLDNFTRLQEYCQITFGNTYCQTNLHRYVISNTNDIVPFAAGRDLASKISSKNTTTAVSAVTLNDFTATAACNYLKIHAEGAEPLIISSAGKFLTRHRPIVAMTVYHGPESSSHLPLLLSHLLSDYKLYFRLHSFGGTGAVLYAIPARN